MGIAMCDLGREQIYKVIRLDTASLLSDGELSVSTLDSSTVT